MYVALNSFECVLRAFDMLFVVIPFRGFFCEARVIDVLVCHFGRLVDWSVFARFGRWCSWMRWRDGGVAG